MPAESSENRFSLFARIGAGVGACAGGIIGVVTLWTMFDLPLLATRSFVKEEMRLARTDMGELVTTVIDLAQDQRERILRTRDGLLLRLKAAKEHQTQNDLTALIAQSDNDVKEIESRIAALQGLKRK